MPRHKLVRDARKKGACTGEQIKKGIDLHRRGFSIRKAAKEAEVAYPTLRRYILKYIMDNNVRLTPNYEVNRVFNDGQEATLKDYVIECSRKFYGLTTKDCRRVAFQTAKLNGLKMPSSWNEQMAGKDWLKSFKKRHPDISIKKPEACSLARATAFNKENVGKFFENLKTAMSRYPCFGNGSRVFNLDETSTTTVQRPKKVIARKGEAVCKVTSGEHGVLVTTCCIVSATGQYLPPAMVFPRLHFKPHMLNGALPGTLGLATSSGWMTAELFIEVMKHFIKQTFASPENPALLLMDNHSSHLSIEALDLAKASGVTVLTLHPHTTAKLQPLDVGLLAPFKAFYNSEVDSWMMRNPGQTFGIYDIASCVAEAYKKAMTPVNIVNAFRKCGIFPVDANVFTEEDYLPSEVTNRPDPALVDSDETDIERDDRCCDSPVLNLSEIFVSDSTAATPIIKNIQQKINKLEDCQPSTSGISKIKSTAAISTIKSDLVPTPSAPAQRTFISPKVFRPPLKAGPRKAKRSRRTGKSMIATDTPEKNQLAELKKKKTTKSKKSVKSNLFKPKKTKPDSDSSDADDIDLTYSGSSSGGEDFISDSEAEDTILDSNFNPLARKPHENEFVIVLLQAKKSNVYYVAKILEILEEEDGLDFYVSYLKLISKWNQTFSEPIEPETAAVSLKDIKYILPPPKVEGKSRRKTTYKFSVDLSLLNLGY